MRLLPRLATITATTLTLLATTAIPAEAAPTVTITAVCDHVTVTPTGWPTASTLKVWVKTRRYNYTLTASTVFSDTTTATTTTQRATTYYTDKLYTVNVVAPDGTTAVLSGTFTRC